jgi:transglutaminase-like putative cysteine protease
MRLPRIGKILRVSFLVPGLLSAGLTSAFAEDAWSIIKIAGTPVGYIFETITTGRAGVRITTSDSKIVLNRLGNRVELETRSRTEESGLGRLLRVEAELRASLMSTKTFAVVKPGFLEITSEAGGRSYFRTVPYSGELLGPEGIRRLSLQKLRAPGDVIDFQTFSTETGSISKGRRRTIARENVTLDGRSVPCLKVEETIEAAGVAGTAWLDATGETVKGEMPTPFGVSEIIQTDRATALAASGGGELPSEMYERSIIKANVRLPQARALDSLRIRLSLRQPGGEWPNLARPGQTVVSKTGQDLVLDLRRLPVPPSVRRPAAETEANREFLRPNEYVQSDLAEIRRAAFEIVGGETDTLRAALKIERWVSDNMIFDLGIAFAPASELIKTKRGTCLGYATLLATLARAAGIPSRVVLGYVYALGMFGGHAWAEVLVGSAWVPLDAAVVSSGIADPARIGFSASSLESGPMGLTGGAAARLFGGTEIKILAFGRNGQTVEVPEDAPVFRVEGNLYSNPGLGFTWEKPSDFTFVQTAVVWPDPTVVGLEGPNGERLVLREATPSPWKEFPAAAKDLFSQEGIRGSAGGVSLGPLSGLKAGSGDKAAIIIDLKPDAWILVAEGRDAPALLDRVIRGLRFDFMLWESSIPKEGRLK